MVSTTLMSLMARGSTVRGLPLRITMSASLPVSSEPLEFCSPYCSAAQTVMVFSPSSGVTRWPGPISAPPREMRFTADHSMNIWSSGATTASVWLVGRSPASIESRIGLMYIACSGPRLAMCASAK